MIRAGCEAGEGGEACDSCRLMGRVWKIENGEGRDQRRRTRTVRERETMVSAAPFTATLRVVAMDVPLLRLAALTGVSRSGLRKIWAGETRSIHRDTAAALSTWLPQLLPETAPDPDAFPEGTADVA